MIRIRSSSSAIAGLLLLTVPVVAVAQGARPRGEARAEGQAVQRGSGGQAPFGASVPPPPPPSAAQGRVTQPAPPPPVTAMPAVQPARQAPVAPMPSAPAARQYQIGAGTAVPRTIPRVVTPQGVSPQLNRPGIVQPRVIGPSYSPYYYGSNYRPYYQPYYREIRPLYRPYYTFRPRLHVGLGLWVGFPVAYPSYFYPYSSYPYSYSYPYPNTYPYSTSVYVAPGTTYVVPGTTAPSIGAAGGLSFEITPADAEVYVDGQYYGLVDQFSPSRPPLALAPGRHHVDIRASGFEIIAFDVDILPGQVIPYRGELQRF